MGYLPGERLSSSIYENDLPVKHTNNKYILDKLLSSKALLSNVWYKWL